jgi:hypothetical protein
VIILETSLSNREGQDCSIAGVTAPPPARTDGVSQTRPAKPQAASLALLKQGSNISSGYSTKLIKEDHFSCVHHKDV